VNARGSGPEDVARSFYEKQGWEVFHAGAPDFLLRRKVDAETTEFAFAEVKSTNDELRHSQRVWCAALIVLGARVDLARVTGRGEVTLQTPTLRSGSGGFVLVPEMSPAPRRASTSAVPMRVPLETAGAVAELNCRRCGYTWLPMTERKPGVCPACKSHQWDKEKKR